jgi:hypothetical protein
MPQHHLLRPYTNHGLDGSMECHVATPTKKNVLKATRPRNVTTAIKPRRIPPDAKKRSKSNNALTASSPMYASCTGYKFTPPSTYKHAHAGSPLVVTSAERSHLLLAIFPLWTKEADKPLQVDSGSGAMPVILKQPKVMQCNVQTLSSSFPPTPECNNAIVATESERIR